MIEVKFNCIPSKTFKFPCLVVEEINPKIILCSRELILATLGAHAPFSLAEHLKFHPFLPVKPKVHFYEPGMRKGDSPKCLNVSFWDLNHQKSLKLNMFIANYEIENLRMVLLKGIQKIKVSNDPQHEELESVFLFTSQRFKFKLEFHEIQEHNFREFLLKNGILSFMVDLTYIPDPPK